MPGRQFETNGPELGHGLQPIQATEIIITFPGGPSLGQPVSEPSDAILSVRSRLWIMPGRIPTDDQPIPYRNGDKKEFSR